MGYFSQLSVDIIQAYEDGVAIEDIASLLNVRFEDVKDIIRDYIDGQFDFDGQPDELTEWLDYDPDC